MTASRKDTLTCRLLMCCRWWEELVTSLKHLSTESHGVRSPSLQVDLNMITMEWLWSLCMTSRSTSTKSFFTNRSQWNLVYIRFGYLGRAFLLSQVATNFLLYIARCFRIIWMPKSWQGQSNRGRTASITLRGLTSSEGSFKIHRTTIWKVSFKDLCDSLSLHSMMIFSVFQEWTKETWMIIWRRLLTTHSLLWKSPAALN